MEVFDIATGMWSFVELCPFANVLSGTCRKDWLLSVPGPAVWATILAGTAVIPGAGSRCVNLGAKPRCAGAHTAVLLCPRPPLSHGCPWDTLPNSAGHLVTAGALSVQGQVRSERTVRIIDLDGPT